MLGKKRKERRQGGRQKREGREGMGREGKEREKGKNWFGKHSEIEIEISRI